MPDCPSLSDCPFYNDLMPKRPAATEMLKSTLCRTNNSQCARWMVGKKLGKSAVPADLYPQQDERARGLVAVE